MPQMRTVDVGDISLRCAIEGDPSSDAPLVIFVHGFPESWYSWRHQLGPVAQAGYTACAIDVRGYGGSDKPQAIEEYALEKIVGDLVGLKTALSPERKAILVGHDWGAATAWVAATLEPSRVASLTALSVPQPEAFMRSWFTSRQGLKSWYMAAFNVPRLPERLARDEGGVMERLLGGGFGMTPDEVARFRREIVEDGALPGGLGWYRGIPFMDRSLLGRRVTVPTTLVWSDGDAAICRAPVDATPRYVDAPYELVVLQGVTHWIPTQAPEAAAEAILERVLGS